MTCNTTTITLGILGSAFFLMFFVVGLSTSKALSLGPCRTGILLIRRFSGFLTPAVHMTHRLSVVQADSGSPDTVSKVELVDASVCRISMTSLRVIVSPLQMILSLALLDSQPIINASLIILSVESP